MGGHRADRRKIIVDNLRRFLGPPRWAGAFSAEGSDKVGTIGLLMARHVAKNLRGRGGWAIGKGAGGLRHRRCDPVPLRWDVRHRQGDQRQARAADPKSTSTSRPPGSSSIWICAPGSTADGRLRALRAHEPESRGAGRTPRQGTFATTPAVTAGPAGKRAHEVSRFEPCRCHCASSTRRA